MNEPNNSNQILDDNFYELASQKIISLLPYVLVTVAKEGKEKLKDLPSDILASLTEKYTLKDFDKWLLENQGIDFLQPPKE